MKRSNFVNKGEKYGKWLVLKSDTSKGSDGKFHSLCRCECGHESEVQNRALIQGKSKSCNHCTDVQIGDKSGKLAIIQVNAKKENGLWYHLCKCECGNEHYVLNMHFKAGKIKSCGKCRVSKNGQVYGRLTVLELDAERSPTGCRKHKCRCICGKETIVFEYSLYQGTVQSCGCLKTDATRLANTKHGHDRRNKKTQIYRTWINIKSRCYNPNIEGYKHYGGRGISMCPEWLESFEAFKDWSFSHGFKPRLSIDRIDNDGNYCPENCQWITIGENSAKRNIDYAAKKRKELAMSVIKR